MTSEWPEGRGSAGVRGGERVWEQDNPRRENCRFAKDLSIAPARKTIALLTQTENLLQSCTYYARDVLPYIRA